MNLDRRSVLLGLGSFALASCAPNSSVTEAITSYRALEKAKREYPFTREQIDGQSLPVMGVQVEGGVRGVIPWVDRVDGRDRWRSANGVTIVTQNGRLIATQGFPQDLLESRVISGSDPLGQPLDPAMRYALSREVELAPDQQKWVGESELRYEGDEVIDLLGRQVAVARWAETVHLTGSRKKWQQVFEVDPRSGQVWRSIQNVGPKMRLVLELLKPPAAPMAKSMVMSDSLR